MVENMMRATPRKASAPSSRSGQPQWKGSRIDAMEPRLTLVTLGVADVARARRSTRRWASRLSGQQDEAWLYSAGGVVLALFGPRGPGRTMRRSPTARPASPASRSPTTSRSEAEVEQVLAEAAAAGGRNFSSRRSKSSGAALRLLRRSRRPPVGGGAQSRLSRSTPRARLQVPNPAHPSMNHDSYSDDYIAGILGDARAIAMVGASGNTIGRATSP